MLTRSACAHLNLTLFLQARTFSAAAEEEITVEIPVPFETHKIDPPSQSVKTTKCAYFVLMETKAKLFAWWFGIDAVTLGRSGNNSNV